MRQLPPSLTPLTLLLVAQAALRKPATDDLGPAQGLPLVLSAVNPEGEPVTFRVPVRRS